MSADIHMTAVIAPGAEIGPGCRIGPYCVVGDHVRLGPGVVLHSHVVMAGRTTVGEGTEIYPFASIGHAPQDMKYKGEPSELIIGPRNRIREHVTINTGTEGGGMVTRVGSDGLFMVGVHIGHDCQIGDHVIMANNATLGGHVVIGDHAVLGGLSAVHQFVRIGAHAMIGGMTGVEADVIPYGVVKGERGHLTGLNLIGLERRGFQKSDIQALRSIYREIFEGSGVMADRIAALADSGDQSAAIRPLIDFLSQRGSRALTLPAA